MFISIKDLLASQMANAPATLRPILESIESDLGQSNQGSTHTQVVYVADPGQATFEEMSTWLKNIGISVAEGWDRKDNYFLSLTPASESTAVIAKEATTPAVTPKNNSVPIAVVLGAFSCLPVLIFLISTMGGIIPFFMAAGPVVLTGAIMLKSHQLASKSSRATALPAPPQEPTYTIGASRAAVLKIQGGPMSAKPSNDPRTNGEAEIWMYAGFTNHSNYYRSAFDKDTGNSWLRFNKEGRLFSYRNYGDLHICMQPSSAGTHPGFFGVGSSQDEVLCSEGTPMSVDYRSKSGYPNTIVEVWTYKCHTIWFNAEGKVASVDTSKELPLLCAKIPHCDRFHPVR